MRPCFPTVFLLPLVLAGCSSDLDGKGGRSPDASSPGDSDDDGGVGDGGGDGGSDGSGDSGDDDTGGEGGDDGGEPACAEPPAAGSVSVDPSCEYEPAPSGNPFAVQVEWSRSHALTDPSTGATVPATAYAEEPTMVGVFQSPAVGQATDDDGDGRVSAQDMPDIAVVMGDEFGDRYSVLRLLSGDGSAVHATASWQPVSGTTGPDYAPARFSGVAMGDTDGDGLTELATVVLEDGTTTCHPALYEVDQSGSTVALVLQAVNTEVELYCQRSTSESGASHAPALADINGDGDVDVILGDLVLEGDDLSLQWEGGFGAGWFNSYYEVGGYWNSGYHSFPYDMDGDGLDMEVVAGNTVYTADGEVYCQLGSGSGSSWEVADDGYPAVADIDRSGGSAGVPEIVLTGNQRVSVYRGQPDSSGHCVEVASIDNAPPDGLYTHASCDTDRSSFGGQPTIADFTGDGDREIGVSGACWYSIFRLSGSTLERYALAPTKDWSSASTGSTVFDFNGDGQSEIVFSDEEALWVWQVDSSSGLSPDERLVALLEDDNHTSWTIHEYPLVADVDNDGKAEILVVNAPNPDDREAYGVYVLGAADDDWVSARPTWNQHAWYGTPIDDDGHIGYGAPNYAPHDSADLNSFRTQAPGSFGALAAADLAPVAEACQEECGPAAIVWAQVANSGAYIGVDPGTTVSLVGVSGTTRTRLDQAVLGDTVDAGALSAAVELDAAGWQDWDRLLVVVDDPELSGSAEWGATKECDEGNNEVEVDLSGLCL